MDAELSAEVFARDFTQTILPRPVDLAVGPYSWHVIGGPEQATLTATGGIDELFECLEWLRCPVEITHADHGPVWWGMIHSVELVVGAMTIGVSLDALSNAIRATYNEPVLGGRGVTQTTAWFTHDDSITTYGRWELTQSIGNAYTDMVEATIKRALEKLALPRQIWKKGRGNPRVTIRCRGWWQTINNRYYSQIAGLEAYTETTQQVQHAIGLGLTGTTIGFSHDSGTVHDFAGRLGDIRSGQKIVVTNSTSNNATLTVAQKASKLPLSYTAATLSFASADDEILDSANGLAGFASNDMILIAGSPGPFSNNGYFRVLSASGDGSKLKLDRNVFNAAAGASITVSRGHSLRVEETTLVDEYPGANTTIKGVGESVAQSWSLEANTVWNVWKVQVRIRKVGSPIDGVLIAIYSTSGGAPGTLLQSASIDAADMATSFEWLGIDLPLTFSPVYGTTYWVRVTRTGSYHYANYYEVVLDEGAAYPRGAVSLLTSGSWAVRSPAADMPFRLLGGQETTDQLAVALDEGAEFITATDLQIASGVISNQYRAGKRKVLAEVMDLINAGTDAQERILATVSRDRRVRIDIAPPVTTMPYTMDIEGYVNDTNDQRISGAKCPVGMWLTLKEVIPPSLNVAQLAVAMPVFIDRAEYNPDTDEYTPEPAGVPSPWVIPTIVEG